VTSTETFSVQDKKRLDDLDVKYLLHPFTALREHEASGPLMMTQGKGCWLTDTSGNRYLDGMAGVWCVNIGYGNEEMAESIVAQVERLSYYHSFSSMSNDVATLLAQRIVELSPVPMSKVFFGSSGSDANDTQVKLIWFYNNILGRPEKKKIISRQRGYHGVSVMTAGLTGLDFAHSGFDVPLPMIRHVRAPLRLWEAQPEMTDTEFSAVLARELEELILAEGPDTVAAFIAEPMQAVGGVIVPPEGYFDAISEVLHRYDVLLIADEVVCGFGRTGKWFGTETYGMQPDLITLAKGITSAYVPLSACLVSEPIWKVIEQGNDMYGVFGHGYTYTAHPLAAAAALTNINIIERDRLVDQAATRGLYLHQRLQKAFGDHPMVAEIRGEGLVGAVEFVQNRSPLTRIDPDVHFGTRVFKASLARGVINRALWGDIISFSPPLIVTESEIDEMVDGTREAFDEVVAELVKA
jgi:L-2,4-diaminobutyrate transaminase